MADTTGSNSKRWRVIAELILVGLAVLPVCLYLYSFGFSLSDNHTRWGEFGSLLGGIYSPLLAFLALAVLVNQVKSQNFATTYQIDHSFIEQSRADLQFYLERLDAALNANHSTGVTVKEFLKQTYCYRSPEDLQSPEAKLLAKQFLLQHQSVFDIWSAVYPIIMGLEAPKKFPYEHNATSARQKTIVLLTYAACVALDNLHYCSSEGSARVLYGFSEEARGLVRL